REPLLWSLHLGYAWLGVGLLLNGVALLGVIPVTAGIHALTVGAISGLIVAVSSRAALGHTGRALTSHPLLTSTFVFINLAACTRVLAALFPGAQILFFISAFSWFIAFATYFLRYFPILLFPKEISVQDGN
ncbi:MAG TPA: NnrS family protein, partial [Spongiibacteraceae bacterium]|nr:NnrS family protein [Spongiibacteraceae bacterium]